MTVPGAESARSSATAGGERSNLNIALALAKCGLPIFPARIVFNEARKKWEKVPLIREWQKQATIEAERLKAWWASWPDAAPGIELARAGLVVLDCDRHGDGEDGIANFQRIVKERGALPDHPIAPTAGGGAHHYFKQPKGEPFTNAVGDLKGTGIDVRAAGGWVVAPGSWRPDGKRWGVAGLGKACTENAIPELPEWVGKMIRPPKRQESKPKNNGAAQAHFDIPELATLDDMLRYIPNNDRDTWRNVGMAINDAYGDAGRAVWSRWSGTSDKYDAKDQDKNWRSFTPGGGITIASVIYLAKQGGWRPDAATRRARRENTKEARQNVGGNAHEQTDADGVIGTQPVITLHAGNLHNIATAAEEALIAAGAPFYSRSGDIVRPIVENVPAFRGRRTNVARLKNVTIDTLRDHLGRTARFERFDKREKKMMIVDPPESVARIILARDGEWRFNHLIGIITTPTLRPDGSILSTPGYDPATGLLLVSPPPMPAIPDKPTWNDAVAAAKLLNELLAEFPFVDEASRSVALSILMTPVARGAMQCVPLHAVTSPEARTGKSHLLDTASAIATGEIAPAIAAGRNEEETEKRIAAELMTSQPIVSIDNLNGDLSGDFICQAIERPIIKPRILGRSETKRIDNTVTMFCNGNNLRFLGDIVPRVILCSMDANMERPEQRTFAGDPVATVLADRGRYIAAILTIIRAYLAAGSPRQCSPLASFGDWSRLIRSSLIWLGFRDPVETMENAQAEDPSRANLRSFVAAWWRLIPPGQRLTAGGLKEAAGKDSYGDLTSDRATLHTAMSAVASNRHSEIEPMKLGRWLSRQKGRVVDKFKICGEKDPHTKQLVWWLADTRKEKREEGNE